MIQTLTDFVAHAEVIIPEFNAYAKAHFESTEARADHICYKCGSSESFEYIRSLFENESDFIYQSIISSRRIAYIKMKRGIETTLGTIFFLELSDQKPDGSQIEGFDHIEVYPLNMSYEDMVNILRKDSTVMHVERPHHVTDDVQLQSGFIFRSCHEPLIEKIKASEMI